MVDTFVQRFAQLLIGGRRIDGDARNAGKHCDVKQPLMGFPIVADNPRPVDSNNHMLLFDGEVVNNLIITPLQEGGVNRKHWDHSICGKSTCEGDRMRLGDPHIKETPFLSERMGKMIEPGAVLHRRRNGTDPFILLAKLGQVKSKLV